MVRKKENKRNVREFKIKRNKFHTLKNRGKNI